MKNYLMRILASVFMFLAGTGLSDGENTIGYSISDSVVPSGLPKLMLNRIGNDNGNSVYIIFDLISSEPFVVDKVEWINLDTVRYPQEKFCLVANKEIPTGKSIAWHIGLDFPYTHEFGRYDHLKVYTDKGFIKAYTNESGRYEYEVNELQKNHEEYVERSEKSIRKYIYIVEISVLIILVLCIVSLYLRNRNMRMLLKYRKALDDIALLRKALHHEAERDFGQGVGVGSDPIKSNEVQEGYPEDSKIGQLPKRDEDVEEMSDEINEKNMLRDRLKDDLLALQKAGQAKKGVPEEIAQSSVYGRLLEYVKAEKIILDNDVIWTELEEIILAMTPEFKARLYLLAGDRLKEETYHMALLIRCGITPTELSVLLGRSKGAISSRRGYTCEMIFGQKLGAKVMDDIIRLL